MTRLRVAGMFLAGLVMLTGCASFEEAYIPHTLGVAGASPAKDGLRVVLTAPNDVSRLGDPLKLRVTLRNEGPEAVWLPVDPHLIMVWVYPNGRNDNMVVDPPHPRHFTQHNAMLLEPGAEVSEDLSVDTYYFPREGITEFRAVLRVPGSTNPDLKPFWVGRAVSNPFGILMVDGNAPLAERRPPARDRLKTRAS